jgi:hypothetical protein
VRLALVSSVAAVAVLLSSLAVVVVLLFGELSLRVAVVKGTVVSVVGLGSSGFLLLCVAVVDVVVVIVVIVVSALVDVRVIVSALL